MYEHRRQAPISPQVFRQRVVQHILWLLLIIGASLGIGVLGYHYICQLAWIDALLNASMILGGMGPVDTLHSDAAKIFDSAYSVFSGIVFIGATGIMLAPFAHRLLHRFHWDDENNLDAENVRQSSQS